MFLSKSFPDKNLITPEIKKAYIEMLTARVTAAQGDQYSGVKVKPLDKNGIWPR